MAEIQTYIYPQTHRVSFGLYHNPSSSSTIKIPKGMGTEVQFIVVNADGRNVTLDPTKNESLLLKIVDRKTTNIVFEYALVPVTPSAISEAGLVRPTLSARSKIYYSAIIPPSASEFLECGTHYRWSIEFKSTESTQALYCNEFHQVEGTVDVFVLDTTTTKKTTIINNTDWSQVVNSSALSITDGANVGYRVYKSGIIQTKTQLGATGELASMVVDFNNFTGRFQLQGCLLNAIPSDDEDYKWFTIKMAGMEYIEPTFVDIPLDGCLPVNLTNDNYMWVRFVILIPQDQYNIITPIDVVSDISIRI